MPVHRRITALLAALTTLAGGPFVAAAAADADAETAERGARPTLRVTATDHASSQQRHASALAGALGVSEDRLGTVLRELRAERRASDVIGARPAVRSTEALAAEREAYAAALAAKVGVDPATAATALQDAAGAAAGAAGAAGAAAAPGDAAGTPTTPPGAAPGVRPPGAPGT